MKTMVLQTIYQKSKKLSLDERASLFINFPTYPGTILYDAGGLFEAKIIIDDTHSEASENRPLAFIEFSDGYNSRVEVIDILESVRNDATLIGHPVILFAIEYWQKILIWEKYSKDDDVYSENESHKLSHSVLYGKYIESARQNLEAIGKAMFEGVKRQAIPKELALTLKINDLKIENKNSYLFVAWERLEVKNVDESHELDERITEIKNYLEQLPAINKAELIDEYPIEMQKYGYIDLGISIHSVIDFLKADGSKFVYKEECEKSQRPKWIVFRNAFIKWFYQKEVSTIGQYKTRAKKQEVDEKPYLPGLFGSSRRANMYGFFHYILSKPLTKFCEPIECPTDMANSISFADLVKKNDTK